MSIGEKSFGNQEGQKETWRQGVGATSEIKRATSPRKMAMMHRPRDQKSCGLSPELR